MKLNEKNVEQSLLKQFFVAAALPFETHNIKISQVARHAIASAHHWPQQFFAYSAQIENHGPSERRTSDTLSVINMWL
ncbi:MAG: hypothetical protein ACOYOK_07100 [Pseudobdellovibrionaceae bacterium]